MTLGATPFSIYVTFSPEQIAYVVGDAEAKVALIEAQFAESLRRGARPPALEHVLVLEDGWPEDPGFDAEPHWRAVEPEDLVTLIYTSGTTGPPKGVQLVHRNLMTAVAVHGVADRLPGRRARHLVAAERAHRRADGAPLPADRLRDDDHVLPEPARGGRATCRRSSRPGSSPCRGSGRSSRPGWRRFLLQGDDARPQPRVARRRHAEGRARAGGRAGARRPRARPSRRPTASCSRALRAMLGLDEATSVNVGAAPTPRAGARVLPRDRHPARRAVGHVGDVRRGLLQPARPDQDRHRRAGRRRASS